MEASNNKNVQIAYIGGGSRNWAWEVMADLALTEDIAGVVRLYDIDMDAAHVNERIGNALRGDKRVKGDWLYKTCESLGEALTSADFVIISILPGTFDEMESDVHTPEKYGIYQSVGDTVGPGGVLRAMRSVPMFVEIAEAIRQYCPAAWVINYTNPMSICTGALFAAFPGIKAFGCCHEVFGTQKLLAKMLEDQLGVAGVDRTEIHCNVLGVNHFTWFDKASWKGLDLYPVFDAFAKKYAESGFALTEDDLDMQNHFRNQNKVGFDMYLRYGLIAVSGDRHIAEFAPPQYLTSPEAVRQYGFDLTPVSYRKANRDRLIQRAADILAGREAFAVEPSEEEGVTQIKALLGLQPLHTNINTVNVGQIKSLPLGAVVETNAVFERDGVRPVFAGGLPDKVNVLVQKHAINQMMLVRAGVEKDTELAFVAFLNDSLMTLAVPDARTLFRQMFDNTSKYLDGWAKLR